MELKLFAGIDIGSNGVRLLIMNVIKFEDNIKYKKVQLLRIPIRLGSDSFDKKNISRETISELTKAISVFKSIMELYKVEKYRICATAALREASNNIEVVNSVFANTGLYIDIISGKEEAQIIFSTQLNNILTTEESILSIDVGGGSTEITYYYKGKIQFAKSFEIGTVRLLNDNMDKTIWSDITSYLKQNKINSQAIAIGTGGNINTIHRISEKKEGASLSIEFLEDLKKDISNLSIEQRIYKYNLNKDRADVIVPALEIFIFILNTIDFRKIKVPKIGLSDGLIKSIEF